MAFKDVRHQMFDVRPLTPQGDLDMERISRVQDVLDLTDEQFEALKEKIVAIKNEIPARPKKRRKKVAEQKPMPVKRERIKPLIREGLEISEPSREEILAVMDQIEELDKYLRNPKKKEEVCEMIFDLDRFLKESIAKKDFEPASAVIQPEFEIVFPEPEPLAREEVIPTVIGSEPAFVGEQILIASESEPELPPEARLEIAEVEETRDYPYVFEKGAFEKTPVFKIPKFSRPASGVNFFEKFKDALGSFAFGLRSFGLRQGAGFAGASLVIFLVIFGMALAGRGLSAKDNILSSAMQAYKAMISAKDSASRLDFSSAQVDFGTAYQNFLDADNELGRIGGALIAILEKVPGGSIVSSGEGLVKAGEDLARAGQSFSRIAKIFMLEKISDSFVPGNQTLTEKIAGAKDDIAQALSYLNQANKDLEKVDVSALPADMAPQVASLKEKLPPIVAALNQLDQWSDIFLNALGHGSGKKYLLVFQNNSEARATGGFMGTFGTVDLDRGQIKNLFINGIYDLDGQFFEKIVPPFPLQNVSQSWRVHDANWFADFPTSAKKLEWFYEKSDGGSTPDGVISITPDIITRLLELTGPIEMPEYGVTLDAQNFLDTVQYKVEIDFNKQVNKPKQILSDFAPRFLDRLWQVWPDKNKEIIKVLVDCLEQKQILFYFNNPVLEKTFSDQGWGGQVLSTEKDYLMVVNTNVNSFKTDKVIDQSISHQARVSADGSIIDRVEITRTHNGGSNAYHWYNEINTDYMRVYVPLGSRLLSARGQSVEIINPPMDFVSNGYKEDPDLKAQQESLIIDKSSGTHIFRESGKTVFGNWVKVGPGQSVTLVYEYLLPFKLNLKESSASYSLLVQKQPGAKASTIQSSLKLPNAMPIDWKYPEDLSVAGSEIDFLGSLDKDRFYGLVFNQ